MDQGVSGGTDQECQVSSSAIVEGDSFHESISRRHLQRAEGYWLWEPATSTVIHTLNIPRAQVVMAAGQAAADATEFELVASHDSENFGIRSAPFLDYAFKTVEFRIKVSINPDGTWSYDEDTVLMIKGQTEPFHHRDRNTLSKIAEATPNPLARK